MRTNFKNIFDYKEIGKIYKKTKIPGVFYLDLKNPISMQYELTSGCNQKCIFCYNTWKEGCNTFSGKIFDKEKQIQVMNKIIEAEIFDLIFSGGEPLLVEWIDELIKKATDNKIDTTLITNGILLSQDKARKLKDAGLGSIQVSLHHYKKEINDVLTNSPGSFEKTVAGIQTAVNIFGSEKVNVNMVALPETYKDVYNTAKFLNSIKVSSFSVATPTATGEMHLNKKLVINKKVFLEIYKQLLAAKNDFNMNTGFTGGFPICILPEIKPEIMQMIGNYCDAGLNQLVVDPEGTIRACVCLSEKLGNIIEDKLEKIWNKNTFLINIRKLTYLPEECLKCKYVALCKGGCRASARGYYGKLNAKDPLMV